MNGRRSSYIASDRKILGYVAMRLPSAPVEDVARAAGVTPSTVYRHAAESSVLRQLVRPRGNRHLELAVDPPLLLALDIGTRHWRLADSRTPAATPFKDEIDPAASPVEVLERVADVIRNGSDDGDDAGQQLRPHDAYDVPAIRGIIVGLPAPVDDDERPIGGPWAGRDVADVLRSYLGREDLPIRVDSDVNLGALAEHRALHTSSNSRLSLTYLKWSAELRAATVLTSGSPHNGDGLADAFLHEPLRDGAGGPVCGVCETACVDPRRRRRRGRGYGRCGKKAIREGSSIGQQP
jgi:AcrR family transcriptional regulator